jgi:hypothetical protein
MRCLEISDAARSDACQRGCGIYNQAAHIKLAMQNVNQDCQHENDDQKIAAKTGSLRNKKQYRGNDLTNAESGPYPERQARFGKEMSRRGRKYKQKGLQHDDKSQSPTQ